LLEPRRIAARAAAEFMAARRSEATGQTIGYRIRFESRVSDATRIEVVTEGILTRMLQDDPELPEVGAVLFDEFHERHLPGDLGAALALDVQAGLRPMAGCASRPQRRPRLSRARRISATASRRE